MARHEIDVALAGLGIVDASEADRSVAARALLRHGDFSRGLLGLDALASLSVKSMALAADIPTVELHADAGSRAALERALHALSPWKKGPFRLMLAEGESILIDAEWRSDLKWQRLLELGLSFAGKSVLDVGTGNGYFLLRLQGAGARLAVGLEPSLRSLLQFLALGPLFPAPGRALWPLRLEELPPDFGEYDTVMSMGVLYHQRDPIDHLERLRRLLAPGGELVLESIVTTGPEPLYVGAGERYAGMRNVYVIPSQDLLVSWLEKAGFEISRLGRPALTTSAEQRSTVWAPGPALEGGLEPGAGPPDDPARPTREGHPRPTRLALSALARSRSTW